MDDGKGASGFGSPEAPRTQGASAATVALAPLMAAPKAMTVELKATHPGVECDGCHATPIRGPRFMCTVCENFDLCSKCEELGVVPKNSKHDPAHPLMKLRTTRSALYLTRRGQGHECALFLDATRASDFVCAICLCVAADGVKTKCRHLFCLSCLHFALSVKRECPLCRTFIPPDVPGAGAGAGGAWDISARATINALRVRCANADLGCEWTGALSDAAAHSAKECGFESCPLARYGCTERRPRHHPAAAAAAGSSSAAAAGAGAAAAAAAATSSVAEGGSPMDAHMRLDAAAHFRLIDMKFEDTQKAITTLSDTAARLQATEYMLAAGQHDLHAFASQLRAALGLDEPQQQPALPHAPPQPQEPRPQPNRRQQPQARRQSNAQNEALPQAQQQVLIQAPADAADAADGDHALAAALAAEDEAAAAAAVAANAAAAAAQDPVERVAARVRNARARGRVPPPAVRAATLLDAAIGVVVLGLLGVGVYATGRWAYNRISSSSGAANSRPPNPPLSPPK